jgi:acetyl-CoA synthetase
MIVQPSFLESRRFPSGQARDYEGARNAFVWPRMPDFNWALDYFDPMAVGNENLALWIVEESGEEHRMSFAALAARLQPGRKLACARRACSVVTTFCSYSATKWRYGEVMLAAIKLGAVLIPTAGLLAREDLRGSNHARFRKTHRHGFGKMSRRSTPWGVMFTRIAVGEPTPGWLDFAQSASFPATFHADARTHAADPLLLYFTSGTAAKPKLVVHTHQSYP